MRGQHDFNLAHGQPSELVAYNGDAEWAMAWPYGGMVRVATITGTSDDATWPWSARTPERIARVAERGGPVTGARYADE